MSDDVDTAPWSVVAGVEAEAEGDDLDEDGEGEVASRPTLTAAKEDDAVGAM